MAFKMNGPSLYQGGALGKAIKVQKDYSGKEDGRATSSPLQQEEPMFENKRAEMKSLRKATKEVKSSMRDKKRTNVKAGRQISSEIDKDLGKEFKQEARAEYKTDRKNFKTEAKKKKQEVRDKWKNK